MTNSSKKFLCPICNVYIAKRKAYLETHLLGKETRFHKSEPNVLFKIKSHLHELYPHKHEKPSLRKIKQDINKPDIIDENFGSEQQIKVLSEKIKQLTDIIKSNENSPIIHNTNTQINNFNVEQLTLENHFHLNFHGSEVNFDMLNLDFMIQQIPRIPDGAPAMIKHIFFNENFRENINTHIVNKKDKQIDVYARPDGWKSKTFLSICQYFIHKGYQAPISAFLDELQMNELITENEHEYLSAKLFDSEYANTNREIYSDMLNARPITKVVYEQTKNEKPDLSQHPKQIDQIKINDKIPAIQELPKISSSKKKKIRLKVNQALMD